MSEIAHKRRMRDWKLRVVRELPGWRIRWYENDTFTFEANKGRKAKKVRLIFRFADKGDIISVGREPVADRCQREIWQVSPNGREVVVIKVNGLLK